MTLSLKVCVYFACQPDETLSTGDIATKFDVSRDKVGLALRREVRDLLLSVGKERGEMGRPMNVYTAGPLLRQMIGEHVAL